MRKTRVALLSGRAGLAEGKGNTSLVYTFQLDKSML